ncbi:unnamed protein product [Bursaphelenchus xylophilus]|uniref:type I protein arginine methyltransferase n=1 Tax=Bursaphelenchus xylophilus TaxID=6326 RepID=A0A1I7RPE2_BURXY|nr:unnamed protein product [Bursaphelenchus xylophilus]CAG9095876.1 unnamed protein product [Bursaphelenchus xylophilus]
MEIKTTNSFGLADLSQIASVSNGGDNNLPSIIPKDKNLYVSISAGGDSVVLQNNNGQFYSLPFSDFEFSSINSNLFSIASKTKDETQFLRFKDSHSYREFQRAIKLSQMAVRETPEKESKENEFTERTEDNSAEVYFHFYGLLHQQQNMLQDYVRTSTYQNSFLWNCGDFDGKVVLDVGAGTGILSFFAVQAGAKKVYAVEASSMAVHCQELIRTNNLSDKITLIPGKIEEVSIPETVDIIISEPMGYMLVNERMLESFVYARKFLKPNGQMFPTKSNMYFSLFSDELLYQETVQRCTFWHHEHFYGVNLSGLKNQAYVENFKQPVVDNWSPTIVCSDVLVWPYDFEKDSVEKLHTIDIPFTFTATRTAFVHGLASWFDVLFCGTQKEVRLSTGPSDPPTHWYQVRCLFGDPVLIKQGEKATGRLLMTANQRLSYDIELTVEINGQIRRNQLDLKNPHFRYSSNPGTLELIPPEHPPSAPEPPLSNAMSFENIHNSDVKY